MVSVIDVEEEEEEEGEDEEAFAVSSGTLPMQKEFPRTEARMPRTPSDGPSVGEMGNPVGEPQFRRNPKVGGGERMGSAGRGFAGGEGGFRRRGNLGFGDLEEGNFAISRGGRGFG